MERKITIHKSIDSLSEKAIWRVAQTTIEQRFRNLYYMQKFNRKLNNQTDFVKKITIRYGFNAS